MRKASIFFFVMILGLSFGCLAQNPYFKHYTTADGLPGNTIYQIFQDSHNFIWFTSDAGVVKFDGSTFTSYRKKDGLSSNDVVRIKEDAKGRVWIFNYNGSVNYIYNNKVYNGINTPFLNSLVGKGFIVDFLTDSNQTIYFYNYQKEVFLLDTNNNVSKDVLFKNFDNLQFVAKKVGRYVYDRIRVSYLSKSPSDEWVIWSSVGIYREQLNQKRILITVDPDLSYVGVFSARNNSYYATVVSNISIPYSYELIKVTGNFKKEKISFPGQVIKIKTIIEDSEGYLWIAAYDEGVYCLKNNKIVQHFNIKDALGLLQDHEQNIWVSTQSDGIYMINHDILEQKHFDRANFDNYGVNRLCDFPGMGIWCTNRKSAFLLKNDIFYKLPVAKDIQPVNIVYMFKDQTLVLGTTSNRLNTFEGLALNKTGRKIGYRNKTMYIFPVKKIFNDRTGLLTNTFDQAQLLVSKSIKPFITSNYKPVSERINNAFYNVDNNLVINAKRNYLYKKNKLEPFPELSRFDGTIITDHLVLDDSTELFNIDGDSLFILQNHRFYNLTDAFDIPVDKQIKQILYDDSTLYLATLGDIFVCRQPTKILSGIPVHLDPMNISFNNINDILIRNDTLFVASEDGLTIIAESSIAKINSFPPVPYLQSININDKIISLPDKELILTGKNNIKLSFGCISYSSGSVIYSYMLEGAEDNWTIGTGSVINLVYQNLPRGHYIFKLRVRKSNSAWSKPLELAITIKPTVVEYPAFWAFVALIASGIFFLIIYRIRIQKMKRVEVDHQLIVMEQKALQSMMNPHFIFNSLASIQNFLLKNKGNEAVVYLAQFARLIRQNLNAINTPMILLDEEADRLRNYIDLEKKRLENRFEYFIEIDKQLEEEEIYIPSMIIQPIVENSIWHGIATLEEMGTIKISFRIHTSKSLKISIEDNGIGMKKAQEYSAKSSQQQHLGMQIIKKRLELLGKKFNTETSLNYSERSPGGVNPGALAEVVLPFIFTKDDI